MKSFRTVFSFTLRDAMRKKFFIISTIFGLVLILVLCALPMILDKTDDSTDTPGMGGDPGTPTEVSKTGTIYFLTKGDFPNGVAAMEQAFPTDEIIPITENELEQSIEMAATSDKTAVIVLNMENGLPMVTAHIKSFFDDSVASYAAKAIQRQWTTDLLAAEGVSEEVALQVANDVPYVVNLVGKMDLSGYIIGILILCIMFFAIYYYGYGVAMSVATEKTSRVMETLLVAARPRDLFWGKCLAMGVLGLAQLSLFLGFGALCYHFLVPEDFLIMGMPLSLSAFTFTSAVLVLAYFLLGYLLYVVLNAASGAMVSRAEDVNSAMMPVMMISMVAFYVAYGGALSGSGALSRIALWIPFASPFLMPFRLLNEQVPWSDIAISISTLVVGIAILSVLSLRLYSISVLHYGTRLKLRDIKKKS